MAPRQQGFQELKPRLVEMIRQHGYERRDEPFKLSSGELSRDYIDGKRAISSGDRLRFAAEAAIALCAETRVEFDAVGGLTMGADALAHAICLVAEKQWFSVRKELKKHGRQQMIEGAVLTSGMRILMVDDVVTTGASIERAMDEIKHLGLEIVLAMALVDRGDSAKDRLAKRGVRFEAMISYRDLDIERVGARRLTA